MPFILWIQRQVSLSLLYWILESLDCSVEFKSLKGLKNFKKKVTSFLGLVFALFLDLNGA